MKKHIAEDLPTRKHPVAVVDKQDDDKKKEGGESSEKRVRQAVYDIRYRARREDVDLKQAFSQYMQNSSMAANERTLVKQKLFGKSLGEEYGMPEAAAGTLAKAMYKVFVEGISYEQDLADLYEEEIKAAPDKKYKVKVTDKNSGRSYVRFATRDKINQLRLNPNIGDVVLLDTRDTREPYEGERTTGSATAAVKAGKDWDGDGKKESPAKEYRGSVHNAIQRRKGGIPDGKDTSSVKEAFIGEVADSKDTNRKLDVMKKGEKNNVKVFPSDGEATKGVRGTINASYALSRFSKLVMEKAESEQQQKLFGLALSVKRGETPRDEVSAEVLKIVDTMSEKKIRDFAKTKHEGLPKKVEESKAETKEEDVKDTRDVPTKVNLIKNKMRAMGVNNPIVMVSSEETVDEAAPLAVGAGLAAAAAAPYLMNKFLKPKVDKAIDKPATGSGGLIDKIKQRRDAINQSYEMEGEVVSEEESDDEKDTDREDRYGANRSRGRDGVTRDSRGRVIMRNPRYRPSQDPRMGSMSDEEWARSSQNPKNQGRRRRY
jgi:hypothetical protein